MEHRAFRHWRVMLVMVVFAVFTPTRGVNAQSHEVASPDGSLRVVFSLKKGEPFYRVERFGRAVIRDSRMGFELDGAAPLAYDFSVAEASRRSVDETWTQPWGEKKDVRNHFNELRLDLAETTDRPRRMTIVFRVYDDGLGFRYEWPEQPHLADFEIRDERTEFALAGDHTAWWIPAYGNERYEYLYERTPVSRMDTVHTPVTMETEDGLFLSFHEAALVDFPSMTLAPAGSLTLKADLVPWSDGVRARVTAPHRTSWRTIQVGDDAGELVTSYLILNLNEPNALGDVSWVRPGKYVGIWWELHLGITTWASGERHGATTENAKRYIDFAARHGFDGVLVEGWNLGWDANWFADGSGFDFTTPYPDFDLEGVARYAAERGVTIVGHHETGAATENYARQMEDAFALYERLGVKGVKTGYVGHRLIGPDGVREWHHGQYGVRAYRQALETAARHRVLVVAHEPIKDTGLRRTFPNMVSREGARGQEYNAWSGDGGNPPEHTTILPFTRLLSGPMDFTPGIFELSLPSQPNNRINTTLAKQLALYVVIYAPWQMAADLPEHYEANLPAFQFIKDVATDWEDTRVLHARIGDYVTIARKERGGDDWYLGSITDEVGRTLEAPLAFLDAGRPYVAQVYRDADDADWETNPQALTIEERLVDAATTLALRLAPGGGQAVCLRPATPNDLERLRGE